MAILSHANLIFFPGIAANERTFEYLRPYFPNMYVPPWLPLEKSESLIHYATRLAEGIPQHLTDGPFYLGGHSFGGILAQEIAAIKPPEAIFLISGFRSHHQISWLYKFAERVTRPIPEWIIKPIVAPYRFIAPHVRRGGKEQLELLVSMFYDTPLQITRWGAQCATGYNGTDSKDIPIYHIHGSDDPLLPLNCAKPDVVIRRGTHLIPITHPVEVAEFIAAHLPVEATMRRVNAAG